MGPAVKNWMEFLVAYAEDWAPEPGIGTVGMLLSCIPLYLSVAGRRGAGEAIGGREPVFPLGDRARE
jgi:hypothetical protein